MCDVCVRMCECVYVCVCTYVHEYTVACFLDVYSTHAHACVHTHVVIHVHMDTARTRAVQHGTQRGRGCRECWRRRRGEGGRKSGRDRARGQPKQRQRK